MTRFSSGPNLVEVRRTYDSTCCWHKTRKIRIELIDVSCTLVRIKRTNSTYDFALLVKHEKLTSLRRFDLFLSDILN